MIIKRCLRAQTVYMRSRVCFLRQASGIYTDGYLSLSLSLSLSEGVRAGARVSSGLAKFFVRLDFPPNFFPSSGCGPPLSYILLLYQGVKVRVRIGRDNINWM